VIERKRGKENLGMSNCLPNESRNPQDDNDVKQFAHYSPSAVSTWQRAVMLSTQVSQQVYAWLKQSAAAVATSRQGQRKPNFPFL
jgi:hypothetical protein